MYAGAAVLYTGKIKVHKSLNRSYHIAIFFFILFFSSVLAAQNKSLPLNLDFDYELEKSLHVQNAKNFTTVKPILQNKVNTLPTDSNKGFLHQNLLQDSKGSFHLNPILHYQAFSGKNEWNSALGAGFSSSYSYNDKLNFAVDFAHFKVEYPNYQQMHIVKQQAVPSMNIVDLDNEAITYQYISAYLNYAPSEVFDFQLGYGRNFIGDGYRSLLLSDHSKAYPYLRVNTQIWKLKYTNLFSVQDNEFYFSEANSSKVLKSNSSRRKYTATHFLDFKVNKWLSIGLFETVVWQAKDSIYDRAYDVNYLNPVIFYRPVEFSTGSADNVLLGLNLKVQTSDRHVFYSQIVLDEFLMAEMKADVKQALNPDDSIQSGWWANKYGIQLGWHAFDLFGLEGLESRLEYNIVRPFTYAHSSPDQSYSHGNLPLAHPLGANFQEVIGMADYYWKKWRFHIQYNYSKGGLSFNSNNFGENILQSNNSRLREYENDLGQGISYNTHYMDVNFSYLIQSKWKLYAQLGFLKRNTELPGRNDESYLYLKLSTALFNQYFDY